MGGAITSGKKSRSLGEEYSIGSIIGIGGFGRVREIRRRSDDQWFALKIIEFNQITLKEAVVVVNESRALKSLPIHPFIIRYYTTFQEKSSLSFVMDLLPGGDLRTLFKLKEKFTEKKAAYVIGCIGEALHHIHLHRIIHRDVKPENIMFDTKGIPKLIDFGISYTAPSTSPGGFCICDEQSGTFNYLSPEAMVPTRYHSFETDFWSLGIVLYEMLFQIRPLDHSKELRHELVQYSSQTYQSVWVLLRFQSHSSEGASHTQTLAESHLSVTSLVPSYSSSATATVGAIAATEALSLFASEEEGDLSFPSSLRIPIPDTTVLKQPVTEHCKAMLSSLLEVRIHRRLGVGDINFPLFQNHKWFSSCSLSLSDLTLSDLSGSSCVTSPPSSSPTSVSPPSSLSLSSHSPLHLDLKKISAYKSEKLLQLNMQDTIVRDSSVPNEILEYFQHIHLT